VSFAAFLQARVIHLDKPTLNQLQQPTDRTLCLSQGAPSLRKLRAAI
jgi:hypothetical protein